MRNLDYCDGMITNWGTHLNDIAQWGAGTERTGPVEIKATGKFHDGKVWNVLERFDAWYKFANGIELFYQMGGPTCGSRATKAGSRSTTQDHPPSRAVEASDPAILAEKIGPGESSFPLRSEQARFHRRRQDPRQRWRTRRSASARPRSATSPTSRSSSAARSSRGIR